MSECKRPLVTLTEYASSGWRFRTGTTGTGAVVFPDSDRSAKEFLDSLQRPLKPSDRAGWFEYANRLGMAQGAAEASWDGMMSPSIRPKLSELVKEFGEVFEAKSWTGYSAPHNLPAQGALSDPPPTQSSQKHKGYAAPAASFPFHTQAAKDVWAKVEKFVSLYPREKPHQILQRAIGAASVRPMMDLTPEDEKLLRMAIDFAQSGPPKNVGSGTP